jgi:DNA repair protein RadC
MGKRVNFFSVRLVKEKAGIYNIEGKSIRSPEDAYDIINELLYLSEQTKEHFVILTLSTKNTILGVHTIHIGSINASIVHPREVFQPALLNNSASIVAFHNHPSGDPSPSREDVEVTKRLVEASKILGIDLLDHIVVGSQGRFVSLKEKGYL